MKEYLKKYWLGMILIAIVVFILVPLGVAFILSFRFIITDTTNEWIGFWGGYLGSIIGGVITLFVLYKTLEDNKKNLEKTLDDGKQSRKLEFCDRIIDDCSFICNHMAVVTLTTEKFVNTAKIEYKDKAIREKNALLEEIWKLITRIEAKRETYAFCNEIYNDLRIIADLINSFSVNDLKTAQEGDMPETIKQLIESQDYESLNCACAQAANQLKKANELLSEHMKKFYTENTKEIM